MEKQMFDTIVIGGGVVGCAIMRRLSLHGLKALLLEKGDDILSGASKANSAILHTGFDAPEGSLEHELVQKGYQEYESIHEKFNLPLIKCGAHIVAWNDEQLNKLSEITEKAHRNNVADVHIIDKEALFEKEPNLAKHALGAVCIPGESIIDPWSAPLAYLSQAVAHGAEYRFAAEVLSGEFKDNHWLLETTKGTFKAKYIINAAGNFGDKIQAICDEPAFTMKPRKGQFLVYDKAASSLINSIILPVPSKVTKGVLLSRTVFGNMILGPTAQEQESRTEATVEKDILKQLIEKGTEMLPELKEYIITSTYAGLRPATEHNGYQIYPNKDKNWICVGGIRSTGLTSALGIASYVLDLMTQTFSIKTELVSEENIIWPHMPSLCEEIQRDYKKPNSGEIVCHCEHVTKSEIEAAFDSTVPPESIKGLKRRTRAMMGRCNGFNCAHRVTQIFREYTQNNSDKKGR